jgi:DNA-binding MarR family transcriptional regulator
MARRRDTKGVSDSQPAVGEPPAVTVERALATLQEWWGQIQESGEAGSPRVPASQMRALSIIERHQDLTLGSLAHELGAIPSSATRLCDRLEAAGLVERESSPSSRREVIVRLTRAGTSFLDDLRDLRITAVDDVLAGMSPALQQAITHALTALGEAAFVSPGGLHRVPDETAGS